MVRVYAVYDLGDRAGGAHTITEAGEEIRDHIQPQHRGDLEHVLRGAREC